MSKSAVYAIVVVVFVVLSLIPALPRGPQFSCVAGNGGSHGSQYGFPFVVVQRSVSPSACTFADGTETGTQAEYYGTHHVHVISFFLDIVVCVLIAIGIERVFAHRSRLGRTRV